MPQYPRLIMSGNWKGIIRWTIKRIDLYWQNVHSKCFRSAGHGCFAKVEMKSEKAWRKEVLSWSCEIESTVHLLRVTRNFQWQKTRSLSFFVKSAQLDLQLGVSQRSTDKLLSRKGSKWPLVHPVSRLIRDLTKVLPYLQNLESSRVFWMKSIDGNHDSALIWYQSLWGKQLLKSRI